MLAGLGVGGIIAGAVLGSQAGTAFEDYSNTTDEYAKLGFRDTTETLQLGAGIAGIGGAALVATGGTLLAIGVVKNRAAAKEQSSKAAPAPKMSFLPSVSVGSTGFFVALRGGF